MVGLGLLILVIGAIVKIGRIIMGLAGGGQGYNGPSQEISDKMIGSYQFYYGRKVLVLKYRHMGQVWLCRDVETNKLLKCTLMDLLLSTPKPYYPPDRPKSKYDILK